MLGKDPNVEQVNQKGARADEGSALMQSGSSVQRRSAHAAARDACMSSSVPTARTAKSMLSVGER